MTRYRLVVPIALISSFLFVSLLAGCTTRQGYHGAGVGALTGTTAGILLDPDNRWRGAAIGGGLGALLGGALTNSPRYNTPYHDPGYYQPPRVAPQYYGYGNQRYYPQDYYQSRAYPRYYGNRRYYPRNYYQPRAYATPPPRYSRRNSVGRSAMIGGVTGATAGALLDNSNAWRGGLIGGALGSFFGGSIGAINSGPSIPVLRP